jgi:formiminotetrahydrofolate cyclodeaminase
MLTSAQLRDQVVSTDPTPAGGSVSSVSIVAAALGAASIQKGITVSLKRSATDFARQRALLELSSRVSALKTTLSELADADSLAFQGYLKACALPLTTEDEKAFRQAAREDRLVRSTRIPLEAAAAMVGGLDVAEAEARLVDPHVHSEVLAGDLLLRASIKSVLLSVDANLAGISDATLGDALKRRRNELERAASLPEATAC